MIKQITNVWDVHYLLGAFIGTVESIMMWKEIPDDLRERLQERLNELNEVKITMPHQYPGTSNLQQYPPIQLKNLKNPE